MCDIKSFSFFTQISFISNNIFLIHPICHCMAIKGKKKSKPLFLCFVYSCHDNKKHESVYHILRRMNPKKESLFWMWCSKFSSTDSACSPNNERLAQAGALVCFMFTVYPFLDWFAFILEGDQCLWHFLNVCVHILFSYAVLVWSSFLLLLFVWQKSTPMKEYTNK